MALSLDARISRLLDAHEDPNTSPEARVEIQERIEFLQSLQET